MAGNNYSRRDFLKTFAALSSVSVLTLMQGCGGGSTTTDNPVYVAYGPPPVSQPKVAGIYYVGDANSAWVSLNGTEVQNVPVNAKFVIAFNTFMDTTAPATVNFTSGTNPVDFTKSWDGAMSLTVTPATPLLNDTVYTLAMGSDAIDSQGRTIVLDPNASVTFKTAAA